MTENEDLTPLPPEKTPDIVELDAVEMSEPRGAARASREHPNRQKPDIFIAQDTNCCSNCCLLALLFAILLILSAIF